MDLSVSPFFLKFNFPKKKFNFLKISREEVKKFFKEVSWSRDSLP